jgi:hypothetical protein
MKHLKRYKIFESNKMISEDDIRSILFEFTDNNDFVIDIEKTSPIEKGLSIMYGYVINRAQGDLEINIGDKISNLRFECIQYRN